MKKIILSLFTVLFLFSCGGSGSGSTSGSDGNVVVPAKFDYKLLSNEAEVKRITDAVLAKVGKNMSKLDEINISVSRPSKEGIIKRERPDYVWIMMRYLNPDNPKRLFEITYGSEDEKWSNGESKDVQLLSGDAETFVLADEMFDASALTSDKVAQIVKEAWDKYKDDAKYSDQWVSEIEIKEGVINVRVSGILSTNGLEKSENYEKNI